MSNNKVNFQTALADALLRVPDRLGFLNLEAIKETVAYKSFFEVTSTLDRLGAQQLIYDIIVSDSPGLVARFGSTELRVVLRSLGRQNRSRLEKAYALFSRLESPLWVPWEHKNIRVKSGFYPVNRSSINKFVELMTFSMRQVDLLGSWVPGENKLHQFLDHAAVTELGNLSPFGGKPIWTEALEGRRVLVIHPFEDSIRVQYQKRHLLFDDPDLIPDFELLTLRAIQSLGTPPAMFPTWFDALESMFNQAMLIDFDIAIIGAGAYGFPLGAMLKNHGKKAIVLGGLVQLMFGIRGLRWDSSGLYNEHWVRPLSSEKPDGFLGADGGAYW